MMEKLAQQDLLATQGLMEREDLLGREGHQDFKSVLIRIAYLFVVVVNGLLLMT